MRRLIVLRPEPGASATVERAQALGLDAFAIPLFRVEPIAWTAPDAGQFEGLLLTSANAVRHGGDQLERLRGLPVYVVGEATAEAARAPDSILHPKEKRELIVCSARSNRTSSCCTSQVRAGANQPIHASASRP